MFKKACKLLSLIGVITIVSGCQITENYKNSPNALSPEEVANIYYFEELAPPLQNHIENLKNVEVTVNTRFEFDDYQAFKVQQHRELYDSQELIAYQIETITTNSNSDENLNEMFVWKDDNYYVQLQSLPFQEYESLSYQPFTYLYFLQSVNATLGEDLTVEQSDDHLIDVSVNITNDELEDMMAVLLDVPIVLSPNANYELNLKYQFNTETNAFLNGRLDATIQDLGHTYKVTHEIDDLVYNQDHLQIDTDVAVNVETTENFIEDFKRANPSDLLSNYDYQITMTSPNEQFEETYHIINPLAQNPYMTLWGVITDDPIEKFNLDYADQRWIVKDKQVNSEPFKQFNVYDHFTKRFINEFDQLEETEAAEEGVIQYREFFEDNYVELNNAVGDAMISQFNQGENQYYGIDYMINQETQQLVGVIIWNGTGGQEIVDTSTRYYINQFNQYPSNQLGLQIHDAIWPAVQSDS